MHLSTLLGTVLVATAVLVLLILVGWSRSRIHRIARRHLETARDIVRELDNGG